MSILLPVMLLSLTVKKQKSYQVPEVKKKILCSEVKLINLKERPGLIQNIRHNGDNLINIIENSKTDPITS